MSEIRLPWGTIRLEDVLKKRNLRRSPAHFVAGQVVQIRNNGAAPSIGIIVLDYGAPDSVLLSRFNVYRECWMHREQIDRSQIIGVLEPT